MMASHDIGHELEALKNQHGAALLSVLLLLAVLAGVLVPLLDHMRFGLSLSRNGHATAQTRLLLKAAEGVAQLEIERLLEQSPNVLTNDGEWNGTPIPVPFDTGTAILTLRDHTACFNINALVAAPTETDQTGQGAVQDAGGAAWDIANMPRRANPAAAAQLRTLMSALDISSSPAQRIIAQATDWLDSDEIPTGFGAEDRTYLEAAKPHLAANQLFRSVSDLLVLPDMTEEIFVRIAPWLCAHPTTQASPININLLTPRQAPLLAMLLPGQLPEPVAAQLIGQRPIGGWQTVGAFWDAPLLAAFSISPEVLRQTAVRSSYAEVSIEMALEGPTLYQTTLYELRGEQLMRRSSVWRERL